MAGNQESMDAQRQPVDKTKDGDLNISANIEIEVLRVEGLFEVYSGSSVEYLVTEYLVTTKPSILFFLDPKEEYFSHLTLPEKCKSKLNDIQWSVRIDGSSINLSEENGVIKFTKKEGGILLTIPHEWVAYKESKKIMVRAYFKSQSDTSAQETTIRRGIGLMELNNTNDAPYSANGLIIRAKKDHAGSVKQNYTVMTNNMEAERILNMINLLSWRQYKLTLVGGNDSNEFARRFQWEDQDNCDYYYVHTKSVINTRGSQKYSDAINTLIRTGQTFIKISGNYKDPSNDEVYTFEPGKTLLVNIEPMEIRVYITGEEWTLNNQGAERYLSDSCDPQILMHELAGHAKPSVAAEHGNGIEIENAVLREIYEKDPLFQQVGVNLKYRMSDRNHSAFPKDFIVKDGKLKRITE